MYYGTREVARLARWLGDGDEAGRLEARAAEMKAAYNRLMLSEEGAVCDGICADTKHTSLHASFYGPPRPRQKKITPEAFSVLVFVPG